MHARACARQSCGARVGALTEERASIAGVYVCVSSVSCACGSVRGLLGSGVCIHLRGVPVELKGEPTTYTEIFKESGFAEISTEAENFTPT